MQNVHRNSRVVLWFFLLAVIVTGCQSQDTTTVVPQPSAVKPAVPVPVAQPQEEMEAEPAQVYQYQSAAMRDPFTPLVSKTRVRPVAEDVPLEPLEKFELDQLRVVAVLLGIDAPRAVIAAPDGQSYIVKQGNRAGKNRGTISSISKQAVVITETFFDYLGNVKTGTKELAVQRQEAR